MLAGAADVKLGAAQSIDYSWGEIDFAVSPVDRPMSAKMILAESADESLDLDVEPDEIEMSDTVTVIWELV